MTTNNIGLKSHALTEKDLPVDRSLCSCLRC